MGLFDRFRKKIKQADQEIGLTAEDGSAEAEDALQKRETLEAEIRKVEEEKDSRNDGNHYTDSESEWDEFEADLEDPFQKPTSSKDGTRPYKE